MNRVYTISIVDATPIIGQLSGLLLWRNIISLNASKMLGHHGKRGKPNATTEPNSTLISGKGLIKGRKGGTNNHPTPCNII